VTDTLDRLNALSRPDGASDTPNEGWAVRDLDSASWAARKASEASAEIARIDAWEQREIDRARAAAATERKRHEESRTFFATALALYLNTLITQGRRTKSLNLPHGTIKFRARQPQLDLDDDAALAYAREHRTDWLRIRTDIDRSALKGGVILSDGGLVIDSGTGEVLPFARWSPQPDSPTFTPAGGDDSGDA
jgi:hypothetical protein